MLVQVQVFCFNFTVHIKMIEILVKGCRNFINMPLLYREFWWNIDWYFIDNFSSFWEAQCFWVDMNQFLICFDFWCCCSMKLINCSSGCSIIWSDLSNLAWSLVSKWYPEDEVSEARVSTSFSMCYNEEFLGSIYRFLLNYINYYSCFSKLWSNEEILACNLVPKWSSEDVCSEVRVSISFLICFDDNLIFFQMQRFILCLLSKSGAVVSPWNISKILLDFQNFH